MLPWDTSVGTAESSEEKIDVNSVSQTLVDDLMSFYNTVKEKEI